MSETQELDPRPREGTTDFSYSKIVNVTHSPKRDHQFVGKTQLHTPSPFRSQVQVSPFVPSASPIMRVITENRTSYMNAHNQLPQKEGNINKNFTKGYLMDRDSPVSKPVSPYHSQETRLLSPGFHRHRLNDPNQISSSGGKQVDVGLVENLDAPSTFRPFYSYLREHGIVADIFDGANNPSQFDNHSDLFDKIHDDKPEDNGLLPHSILYGTPVEHDKTTFKVHKLTSQDRATSGVSFEEPVFEVGTNGNLNQWQYNQNGNLDVFVKHTPSSTTSSKINSNAGMLQRDDNTYPGTPRPVSSSDTNVGAGLNLTIQKQHTLEQATYKQNDNTRLDNHRPLPKPLPPFYREQNSKDNFLRSSYVIFTPPGRVFAKSSTTAVPFPITTPSGATHNPLQLTIDNLPDPIHASSKETRVIVRGEDKFNTFSSPLKLPSSVISAPPPYYPPTEPSITLIPPAFIHPPTPLPDNIPPPPSLPQENKVTNTHENIITITDGGTTHFSKIHENDPNFVENNDFHGLINFELQNNNGNFQADQGSFVNQHHKTNVSPEHSLNEIKSSSVSNIEHDKNAFNSVHNTLYRQTPQQFTVTLSPNLRQEVTPNAVTKTEDPLNSFQNQNSDYPNNIMDDDNFPDAFASFEEAQLLDREKQENGNASPLVYKSAELIDDDDHKENYKKEHSVEVSKPNFYDSHELLSHEIRSTQIGPDKRPYFVHDHPRPDHNHNNRRPPFLPDNRRPQYNKDTRRPPFITGSRHPEGSEEFRRPNFIQNFRGPHFSQERGRPQFHPESRRPLLNHGNRRPNFIQENRRPKFSHTGRPFHGSTEFDAFDEDSENRIPPHNSNARRPSLQPFPLELSHLKPPPEHLRPPPHSTISAEHAYLSGNDLSLNNLHSEEDEILNSSESIRNQQNGLKFSDNRQKYSDHNFPTSSSREKFQFRDHQANSFHSHQERPHFHPPSPNSHFSTSSGLRGHGHFHEPLHPSSHGSRHPHLRSEGKRPTPYSPPPPPPPPPSPPKPLGHHRSPPLPVITHIRNSNNPTRARPFPHGIRARRPFLYPDDISKETFPEVVRGSQEHSVEHNFHRGNNQQNSREKERARFPSSHEMENDFTPMREVSQPLPEDSRENRMLISESHAKMMKNMRYGIDGKPLDVWIPIVGKEVPKSKIASNGGERIQHESIRSNIPNQEKNHRDQPSIHNPHHDHSHRDKGSNLILDEYDYHNHHSREVDYLEYSHDDDDDYEYHEVNERDFKVKTNKDPPRENSDNDGITEEALSTTQISSPTNSYKGPRYNVINFPNVNIGSSGT
ncbi:hypothetical protein SK128_009800 [Halocaridina rubra]|uniref:Uncharacterized protein n=1 Tax=Halocaridina rubra TaxID=373956 RepID=A0AAN9AG47_HALRR